MYSTDGTSSSMEDDEVHVTPTKGFLRGHANMLRKGFDINSTWVISKKPLPFKVKEKIYILFFDIAVDVVKLDAWIDQLETYFILYEYDHEDRVAFTWLKLTNHVLAWWNEYLHFNGNAEICGVHSSIFYTKSFIQWGTPGGHAHPT